MAIYPYASLDWLTALDQLLLDTAGAAVVLTLLAVTAVCLGGLRRSLKQKGSLVVTSRGAPPIHGLPVDPLASAIPCEELAAVPLRPRNPR